MGRFTKFFGKLKKSGKGAKLIDVSRDKNERDLGDPGDRDGDSLFISEESLKKITREPDRTTGATTSTTKTSTQDSIASTMFGQSAIVKYLSSGRLPLIGYLSASMQYRVLFFAMTLTGVVFLASSSFYIYSNSINSIQTSYVKELYGLFEKSSRIATLYSIGRHDDTTADSGKTPTETDLSKNASRTNMLVERIVFGGSVPDKFIPLPAQQDKLFTDFLELWRPQKTALDKISASQKSLAGFFAAVKNTNKVDNEIYTLIMEIYADVKSTPADLSHLDTINSMALSFLRVNKNLNSLITSPDFNPETISLISKGSLFLVQTANSLSTPGPSEIRDSQIRKKIVKLNLLLNDYFREVEIIQTSINGVKESKNLALYINNGILGLNTSLKKINERFDYEDNRALLALGVVIASTFFFFFNLLVLILKVISNENQTSIRILEEEQKNKDNQVAIDHLLLDMVRMGVGDLTTRITVSRDFTAPIAIGINRSIRSLQEIVLSIKAASKSVAKTSEEAKSYASILSLSATVQSEKMNVAIGSIHKITSEIDEIAQKTWLIKGEAEKSQSASQSGEQIVKEAVSKMNSMRENIQESAKKIKRLGESSQSIGEVSSLIRDITKQIKILALNAAIHAASSGGSGGKAFSVLAQEVQRLATDSSDATTRIEEMVDSIQNDARIAVSAMEKTTQEVVEGTRLSDRAGNELKQIYEYSMLLAKMIGEITDILEQKSGDMTNVSLTMKELQESNSKSLSSVKLAVDKTEEINAIAKKLEQSVANFKVE